MLQRIMYEPEQGSIVNTPTVLLKFTIHLQKQWQNNLKYSPAIAIHVPQKTTGGSGTRNFQNAKSVSDSYQACRVNSTYINIIRVLQRLICTGGNMVTGPVRETGCKLSRDDLNLSSSKSFLELLANPKPTPSD